MTDEALEETSQWDAQKHLVERYRKRIEAAGVEYRGHRWRGDAGGRQAITETIAAAEDIEANGGTFSATWQCLDGWLEDVTLSDLRQVRMLIAAKRDATFKRQKELHDALDARQDVDIYSGWPE